MSDGVKRWDIRYRAHNRRVRPAVILLPAGFGPRRPTPALPLVISPHGRNVRAAVNASKWGDLPARGRFALVCPGGMGRKLPLASWGWRGQIADLARMPEILRAALPWLRVNKRRIYAVGGSMGGQETLLLLGQYPRLLAGAVAFDSVTNFYRRYSDFARSPGGRAAQALARARPAPIPAVTSSAAQPTGSQRLPARVCRCNCGGATPTRS
jgi:poly(3-hydroxybutyrate) depolymerase